MWMTLSGGWEKQLMKLTWAIYTLKFGFIYILNICCKIKSNYKIRKVKVWIGLLLAKWIFRNNSLNIIWMNVNNYL